MNLFGKTSLPGAPTEFIDSRSLEEFRSTREFEDNVTGLQTVRLAGSAERETPAKRR